MRLIDADAVDAIIDAETERTTTFVEHETQANIKFAIKNLPTVEPVRGEWVPEEKMYRSPLALNYRCSQCGETSRKTNFCPNCGCDMRGEKND